MICRCLNKDINGNLCKGRLNKENEYNYSCEECKTNYLICPECDGEGFAETENGFFDCDCCEGTGLIIKSENF
jgi:hypothetical protein